MGPIDAKFGLTEVNRMKMNRIRIILGAMCLLVVPAMYAQEPADEPKPPKHEEARPEPNRDATPAARQNDAQPATAGTTPGAKTGRSQTSEERL